MIKSILLAAGIAITLLSGVTSLAQQPQPKPQTSGQQLSGTPLSEQSLTQIFDRLSQTEILRAHFAQQKTLPALKRNYLSSGEVCFARQHGIVWQLTEPVTATLVVGSKKIVQKTANTHSEIALNKSPYAGVATVFLEIMAGNKNKLEENFELVSATTLETGRWAIVMRPKTALFAQLFTQVSLQGDRHIEQILLAEAGGTHTALQFSQHQLNGQPVSADEYALFKLAQ